MVLVCGSILPAPPKLHYDMHAAMAPCNSFVHTRNINKLSFHLHNMEFQPHTHTQTQMRPDRHEQRTLSLGRKTIHHHSPFRHFVGNTQKLHLILFAWQRCNTRRMCRMRHGHVDVGRCGWLPRFAGIGVCMPM